MGEYMGIGDWVLFNYFIIKYKGQIIYLLSLNEIKKICNKI